MSAPAGLDDLDAVTIRRADDAASRLEAVLRRATARMAHGPDGPLGHRADLGAVARWQHLHVPDRCWAAEERGFAELLHWPHDGWIAAPRRLPVLSAGFTFAVADHPPVLHPARAAWRDAVLADGIHIGTEGDAVRCSRLLYVAELVALGHDGERQAAALAAWADRSVAAVAALSPPAVR